MATADTNQAHYREIEAEVESFTDGKKRLRKQVKLTSLLKDLIRKKETVICDCKMWGLPMRSV